MNLIRIGNQLINLDHLSYARLDGEVLSLQLGHTKGGGETYSVKFTGQTAKDLWEEITSGTLRDFD